MTDERRFVAEMFADEIRKRLGADTPEKLEVADALGYACTLRSPRTFNGVQMDVHQWREFARRIDRHILDDVANGLKAYGSRVRNRCWYILGILANEYNALSSGRRGSSNFTERRYTAAELNSVMVSLDDLDKLDL